MGCIDIPGSVQTSMLRHFVLPSFQMRVFVFLLKSQACKRGNIRVLRTVEARLLYCFFFIPAPSRMTNNPPDGARLYFQLCPNWNCSKLQLSIRIKDAGIAIRHSWGRILFYTAGCRNGFQGTEVGCPHTKNRLTLSKTYFFVIEKCFEDVKQDEKHVLDLLESIMRPKLFVKEELWPNSFKMIQIGSKIKTIRVSTF